MKPVKLKMSAREYRVDPWTAWSRLREIGPVIPIKSLLLGNGWAATSYESVSQVLRDDQLFVRNPSNAGRKTFGNIQWILPRSLMALSNNMIAKDGVDHRRLRSLVDKAFARRSVESMTESLGKCANDLVDECKQIAANEGRADLVRDFARPFPFFVICELLGLPADRRHDIHQWLQPISNFSGALDFFRMLSGIKKMKQFLKLQFEEAEQKPRSGLISELIAIQKEGEQLSEDELMAMVFMLFVAGHETTVHLISNCIVTFAQFPKALNALMSDWNRADMAIEEVLRYCSPVQFGKPRFVTTNTEFFGQDLKRGQMILPLLASANYDPEKFFDPEVFDIERSPNYHLTFGSGPHTCLGIKLARAETSHALKALYTRWPDFRMLFDVNKIDWSNRPGMRGIRSLPVS